MCFLNNRTLKPLKNVPLYAQFRVKNTQKVKFFTICADNTGHFVLTFLSNKSTKTTLQNNIKINIGPNIFKRSFNHPGCSEKCLWGEYILKAPYNNKKLNIMKCIGFCNRNSINAKTNWILRLNELKYKIRTVV